MAHPRRLYSGRQIGLGMDHPFRRNHVGRAHDRSLGLAHSTVETGSVLTTMALNSLLEQLADFDTALLANTIGYIDPTPVHEWYMGGSIASQTPTVGPTAGVAMTLEIDTSTPGNRPEPEVYYELLKAIEKSPS